jgi:hypothetical protein
VTLVGTTGLPAIATYSENGNPTKTFNYRTHGINPTWVSFYDTGNIRWNQRVGSRIGRSASSGNDATAGSYPDRWYGAYLPRNSRANRAFTIKMNSGLINQDYTSGQLSTAIPAFITHELGHALSLGHPPSNRDLDSIMDPPDVNSLRILLPTAYDISEVARIY